VEFKKTPKQTEATKLAGLKSRHLMLYGGSRSGKTFDHVRRLFIRASKCKSRHVIFRDKFNACKRAIWKDTIPKVLAICFPELKATPNNTDYYYKLPNDSEVWIGGLDNKERTEKILGMEFSTIYFNECSEIAYESVLMAKTRLAEKNDLVNKFYFDQNPPSKRHWAYWLWERGVDPLSEEPVDKDDYISLLMNPIDNLENIDEEYISILESMPEKERNRFLHGVYSDDDDGQAYYEFEREKHVEKVIQRPGSAFIAMDFNVDPMAAILFQVINKEIHVFDEVFLRNSDTPKICKELLRRGYRGLRVIPDSTGGNRKTSGQSDFEILKQNGFSVENVHNPFISDRVNNVNRLLSTNRIKINSVCKKLINDLEKVTWKDNKLDQKTDKTLTHISDCLGYGCWKIDPIVGKSRTPIRLS